MLSTLVACLLVLGASAFGPPAPNMMKRSMAPPLREDKEPCCSPKYFTFSATVTDTSLDLDGNLLLELIHVEGAYDAVSQQYSLRLFENFFNKTERHLRIIEDYKERESYLILRDGDEELCFVSETEGVFEEDCVPDDAVYVGETTVGDRGLVAETWYYASEDTSTHTTYSVQAEECVGLAGSSRQFDLATGKEIKISNTDFYNFNLGICDREAYFKPPSTCDEGRALSEPNAEMVKFMARRRKGLIPL